MMVHSRIRAFLALLAIVSMTGRCPAFSLQTPPTFGSPEARTTIQQTKKRSSSLGVRARRQQGKRRKNAGVLSVEKDLTDRGFFPILGSDESGRGCVAGPVVAATCAILVDWDDYCPIPGVRDSKEISSEERRRIYEEVVSCPETYLWSIAERSHAQIDEENILKTTMDCFQDSIEAVVSQLPESHTAYSIVDGKKGPKLSVPVPSRPWVKGDKEVYTVALASILAKVSRDRMASDWHSSYPEYGFDVHKGYATQSHIEAIHKFGPCPIHRLSFKTLKGR